MTPGERAEARIAELGITDPRDIDVDAIAYDARMLVEYEALEGCEAMLVGAGDRAIATVRPSNIRGRERFSVGHELGHWEMHRGKSFACRADDPDRNLVSDRPREREADEYSAHLLMPTVFFAPAVKSLGRPGFKELDALSAEYETSLLATVIRLANIDTLPVIVACYSAQGLKWSKRAKHVPARWWLRSQLDEDSFAHGLLTAGTRIASARKQPGEVWFENDDAENYEVIEDCIPGKVGEVLVLLYLSSSMLDARFDPNVGARRYNESGSYVKRR
ncbi:MAG: ImmA/IrrE family metallo-endopeptidase [Rhodocyclaceae bacterium]|jgi:Zn-dependent peptidase ImmA (M78 family)|nr:ImmA/IrrE family metallo-endopeptidase [Rhodocyclaceae bacterium]MCA3103096.1 ImmA/IrrE family metallo-endopeptidase [Rhodocyclaceae bacterium]MCA3111377.1 ImmA/IrrE family metallo-endopeptidase [Rhodocyclaceae bacterium]MCA3115254.1 ImmA/IrrE family metallo-endopeptidase [Rhodocyclaceae bacterium]MCA3129453.1 ImmA/IrrE family metallo-endopeptidase [Rhodocyclaceae bacterium]